MINRRRPIQSIVAGRKMFSNGGVVPPPMGPPPMGAAPMGPPPMGAAPMGILNSSPELAQAASFSQPPPTLVDSITNEMTTGFGQGINDVAAMNAAPVPMAQGGLASEDMVQHFQRGGFGNAFERNQRQRELEKAREAKARSRFMALGLPKPDPNTNFDPTGELVLNNLNAFQRAQLQREMEAKRRQYKTPPPRPDPSRNFDPTGELVLNDLDAFQRAELQREQERDRRKYQKRSVEVDPLELIAVEDDAGGQDYDPTVTDIDVFTGGVEDDAGGQDYEITGVANSLNASERSALQREAEAKRRKYKDRNFNISEDNFYTGEEVGGTPLPVELPSGGYSLTDLEAAGASPRNRQVIPTNKQILGQVPGLSIEELRKREAAIAKRRAEGYLPGAPRIDQKYFKEKYNRIKEGPKAGVETDTSSDFMMLYDYGREDPYSQLKKSARGDEGVAIENVTKGAKGAWGAAVDFFGFNDDFPPTRVNTAMSPSMRPLEGPSTRETTGQKYPSAGPFGNIDDDAEDSYPFKFQNPVVDKTLNSVAEETFTAAEQRLLDTGVEDDARDLVLNDEVINLPKADQRLIDTGVEDDAGGQDYDLVKITDSAADGTSKLVRGSSVFSALTRGGRDGDMVSAALDSVVKRGAMLSEGNATIDVTKLKDDLEALMPAIEEDTQTEALLGIMLGAAIAGGTSKNALKNIKDGIMQVGPSIINYKAKIKSDKRARSMAIAKLAINQKLGLEAEQRAEQRMIRQEDRAEERKRLTPSNYAVTNSVLIPRSLIPGQDDAEGKILIPKRMTMSLDYYAAQRLRDLNVPLVEIAKPQLDDDVFGDSSPTNIASMTPKQMNRFFERVTTPHEPFKKWGSGYKMMYYVPKPASLIRKDIDNKNLMTQGEYNGFTRTYRNLSQNYRNMYAKLDELKRMDSTLLVGTGALKEGVGDALKGLGGAFKDSSILNRWGNALLGGKDQSEMSKFEAKGRILLARLTPILLGESGKTISDADRIRVAQALGFQVDVIQNADGSVRMGQIKGFNDNILKNPASIGRALNETAFIITDSLSQIHGAYQAEMDKFNVNILDLQEIKYTEPERLYFNLTEGS